MNGDSITVSGVEAEYTDIGSRNAWALVYQKIGRECQAYPYTCTEAKKSENKPLNRYRDVNPYDHSRVILKRCERDYINANLVKMDRANRKYILTQGPLASTVGHFWLMVWEQRSKAILMLNKIIEKNETKCHWYWPRAVGEDSKMTLSDVKLTIEQISEDDFSYYSTRVFRIVDMETSESREVIQFHYTTWPDFGVPSSPVAFLEFLKRVRASGALEADAGPAVVHCSAGIGRSGTFCLVDSCLVISREVIQFHYTTWPDFGVPSSPVAFLEFLKRVRASGALEADAGPAVVHCSAGIGRSGTFCLVDSCLVIIEKEGIESVNVQQILLEMRKDRMGLIQTPDQLRFSYQAIIEGTKRLDPDYKEPKLEESIYSSVPEEAEELAPPPPPRTESLSRAPARPLPSIPVSTSLGNVYQYGQDPSSDESPPASPAPDSSSADDADDDRDPPRDSAEPPPESATAIRRRRNQELADRVSAIKRASRDAERWNDLKRSLYKPLTITFGVLLAGIVIYAYVKH